MDTDAEMDQFQILEEKIDKFIQFITTLKREKEALSEKAQAQAERILELTNQLESSRNASTGARQRIAALLEKMEQIDI
jgi:FtsZ-binding cell division protein ZapB